MAQRIIFRGKKLPFLWSNRDILLAARGTPCLWYMVKVIYPQYSKHWLSIVAHTITIKSWFKPWIIFFTFQVFWVKKHSGLKSRFLFCLICILVWLDVQTNLPETNPFFVYPNGFDEHLFSNVYITWDV